MLRRIRKIFSEYFFSGCIQRPMFFGAVLSVTAILFCVYSFVPAYTLLFLLFGAGIAVAFCGRKYIALWLPLVLLFITVLSLVKTENRQKHLERAVSMGDTVTLTVVESPYLNKGITQFKAGVNTSAVLPEGMVVLVKTENSGFFMGDIIEAQIVVDEVCDTERSLYYMSEDISCVVSDAGDIAVVGSSAFYSTIGKVRQYIKGFLDTNLETSVSATLNALLIGERSDFEDNFQIAVRQAGLSHVMVVSGMHLAIIMGGLMSIFRKSGIKRIWQNIIFVAAVFFFMAVCGFTMSIQRAAVTYVLAMFAPLVNRDNDPLNTLSGAVCIILINSPYALFSISFQLSSLATFGILVIMPILTKRLFRIVPDIKILRSGITVFVGSLAATFTTLPVIIWNFGSFSLVAPVSNLLISYAVTIAMLITSIAIAVSVVLPFDIFIKPLLLVSGVITKYINYIINTFGSSGYAMAEVGESFAVWTVGFIALFLIIRRVLSRRQYISQLKRIEKEG